TIKILDMGLVYFPGSTPNENSQLTVVGTVIGTPDYIAPEQTLDSHCVDIRADIYSLGCTFYYLLAGKPPFGDYRLMQKLMMHQTKDPKAINELRPEVPQYVADVVHKLCAKKPEDRYQTPLELATALTPAPPPGSALSMMSMVLPAHTPLPGSLPPQQPSAPDSSSSIHSSQRPISMFDTMARLPEGGSAGSTIIKLSTPIPDSAQISDALRAQPEAPTGPPPPQQFAVLKRHNGWVTTVSFSPSRRTLASGGVDGALKLWDLGSNPQDKSIDGAHSCDITKLAYAPDSEYLATASGGLEGMIRLWHCNGTDARPAQQITLGMTGTDALRFSPEGRLLAAGGSDNNVRLWDVHLATPKLLATLKGHQSDVKELAFLPDGNILISASRDGSIRVWNLAKFWSKEQATLEGLWGQVFSLGVAPDGDRMAFGALDQKVYVWEMTDTKPKLMRVIEGHNGTVKICHFNPDGETLLTVCDRGLCVLWDLRTGARRREWQLTSGSRSSMAVTFDGRYLAAGNSDGTISLYRFYPRRDRPD
ncbi:MAG: hypothetical protein AB7K24_33655, partial [Gemmataceae bacterium]